eukprot:7263719-Prymnesium_polylepis.1
MAVCDTDRQPAHPSRYQRRWALLDLGVTLKHHGGADRRRQPAIGVYTIVFRTAGPRPTDVRPSDATCHC